MRTTQAARYARWSAMIAGLLIALVASSYLRLSWQARQERKSQPSAVPAAVQQQSAEFSFSKVTGDRTEFTVRASHTTEFTGGARDLLEDVWVTFYGKDGQRSDNLHTRTCEFLNATGSIVCAGDVQVDLQSADDARQFPGTAANPNPAAHVMHVTINHVTFNRNSGIAESDQPVKFVFAQGHGQAVGFHYESQAGEMQLLHNVDMTFERSVSPGVLGDLVLAPAVAATADGQPLHVTSSSLRYQRDERIVHLQGPVSAQQGSRRLQAGQVAVTLDAMLRAKRIDATDHPVLDDSEPRGPISVSANELSADLSAEGWSERVIADGNVHAEARGPQRQDRLDANRVEVQMGVGTNQPRKLTALRNVTIESDGEGGLKRKLATSLLSVEFVPGGANGQSRIANAVTPSAVLDWQAPADPATKTAAQHLHLSSQHLEAAFGATSDLRAVRGTGGVEVERRIDGGPPQTSASREMLARLLPNGDWSSVDLTGDVHLRQADQTAQANLAHFDHVGNTAVLTGAVVLSDPRSRLTAQSGTFHQLTDDFQAEGHVVTNEVSSAGGASNLSTAPARISSDRLVVNNTTGHAVYSGQARLWQGNSIIEADNIELDRRTNMLTANNHVRAVFPQAAWTPPAGDHLTIKPVSQPVGGKAEFCRVEAGRLTYRSNEGRARLEQRVTTHTDEGSLHADNMDLFFAPAAAGAAGGNASPKADSSALGTNMGAQQLVRATAVGNVILEQEDRKGTSTQADYTASEGKFVLTGGPPVVHDASGNSTTGRQLTLFFADDRIVIDSAEGLRTLTLHRVEK